MIATATRFAPTASHNCWDPRTWTKPGSNGQQTSSGLTDLKNPLVQKLVKQQVENFFRGFVPPRPTTAPKSVDPLAGVDVTPKFLMGANYQAFNVNGELMVKVTAVTQSPQRSTWYDLGKVPAADVVSPMFRDSFTPAVRN